MNQYFNNNCSCGGRLSWFQRRCAACGTARGAGILLFSLILGLLLLAVFLFRYFGSDERQSQWGLPSHSLTEQSSPEQEMARVDTLMKDQTDGDRASRAAIQILTDLTTRYPDFGYGLRLLANLQRNLHQDEQALRNYEKFQALHPNDARTTLAYAEVQLRGNHPERGIEQLEKILKAYPLYADAHDRLAKGYARAGDEVRAKAHEATAKALLAKGKNQKPPFLYLPRLPESAGERVPQ